MAWVCPPSDTAVVVSPRSHSHCCMLCCLPRVSRAASCLWPGALCRACSCTSLALCMTACWGGPAIVLGFLGCCRCRQGCCCREPTGRQWQGWFRVCLCLCLRLCLCEHGCRMHTGCYGWGRCVQGCRSDPSCAHTCCVVQAEGKESASEGSSRTNLKVRTQEWWRCQCQWCQWGPWRRCAERQPTPPVQRRQSRQQARGCARGPSWCARYVCNAALTRSRWCLCSVQCAPPSRRHIAGARGRLAVPLAVAQAV
jgi:hypothetical protein